MTDTDLKTYTADDGINFTSYTDEELCLIIKQVVCPNLDELHWSDKISVLVDGVEEVYHFSPIKQWSPTPTIVVYVTENDREIVPLIATNLAARNSDYANVQVWNLKWRHKFTRQQLLELCISLYGDDETLFNTTISSTSVKALLSKKREHRLRAKDAAQLKRAMTFSYKDQHTICWAVLRHIGNCFLPDLQKSILKNPECASIKIRYFVNNSNYFWDLCYKSKSYCKVDLTGKQLYDSIVDTFNVDINALLHKLANDSTPESRRFVTAFTDKYRPSALTDKDPLNRILARTLHKKGEQNEGVSRS